MPETHSESAVRATSDTRSSGTREKTRQTEVGRLPGALLMVLEFV